MAPPGSMIRFNSNGELNYFKNPVVTKSALGMFTTLEEIGLTKDTASSYEIVNNAMPFYSTLTLSWTGNSEQTPGRFGAFGQLMPAGYGTCIIKRMDISVWEFYPLGSGTIFVGTYTNINSIGWSGWNTK